jgi:hypothetical protein
MGTVGDMTTLRAASSLIAAWIVVATSVAACSITGGTLGGRERCWPEDDQRIPSLMKGTLHVGDANPTLLTPEGEVLPLRLSRFDLRTDGSTVAISDPGGGGVVATNGELVTLFGGLGRDGSMYVCGVEERGG